MIKDFISLIFPRNCLNCQQSLISAEDYLCTGCKIDLPLTNDWSNPINPLYQKFAFESRIRTAASFLYFQRKGITQRILHSIKYKGQKELGLIVGKWFGSSLDLNLDMIIPVPLHKSKLRARTYNQSEEISNGIANKLGIKVHTDIIRREVATLSQTRKSKASRWLNMNNVYSKSSKDLSGLSVLVVDDVITTGATVGMLCERLVEANVAEIHIASLARGK